MKTIDFFKQICNIPHESGNEEKLANYLCNYAKNKKLPYYKDDWNNVIITKVVDDIEPIILQAHIDMVCEKENINFDFEKDSIELIIDEKYIKANKTTLGADNGIGVAQILNLLENENLSIEAVFTTCEETTMIGAMNIDTSILKGKNMINLDGFEENVIITESAAFSDIIIEKNYTSWNEETCNYTILLSGLSGGHSGFEIQNKRGNAIVLLSKLLLAFNDIQLSEFNGGTKFNVIPSMCMATFKSYKSVTDLNERITTFLKKNDIYSNLKIELKEIDNNSELLSNEDSINYLNFVSNFPNEVIYKQDNHPTTSINLGIANIKEKFMVGMRSSRIEEETKTIELLKEHCSNNDFIFNIIGHQSGFQSNINSNLVQTLLKTSPYEFNTTKCKSVHITVESGFFKEKMPNLEIAIISPNIQNAHSTKECVEIESIIKTDQWLLNFIKEMQKSN